MSRYYVAERSIIAGFIVGSIVLDDLLASKFDARSITDLPLRVLFVAATAVRQADTDATILDVARQLVGSAAVPELEEELERLRCEGALAIKQLRADDKIAACAFPDCEGEATVLGGMCMLCEREQHRGLIQLAVQKELRA